jgi:transposase-like protein
LNSPYGYHRRLLPCCHRVFQLSYIYEARKFGVKEQIVEVAFNGVGVRDTFRTLKFGLNTVIRALMSTPGFMAVTVLYHWC